MSIHENAAQDKDLEKLKVGYAPIVSYTSKSHALAQGNDRVDALEDYFDPVATKALVWKQDLRIVPLAAAIYLLCYLDRSNIGEPQSAQPAIDQLTNLKAMRRRSTLAKMNPFCN